MGKSAEPSAHSLPATLEAGQVYSFRTRPFTEFSPPATGRFAAIRILGVNDEYVVVAVLDAIWLEPPTFEEVRTISTIIEHRFAAKGPGAFGVPREWWTPVRDLDEVRFVGTQPVSRTERSFFEAIVDHAPGSCFATLSTASSVAEGEWRWSNDREAVVLEIEQSKAKAEARRAAEEERYRTRLRKLTWEQLQSETPFERWSESPPFPSAEFTNAARDVIRGACDSLKALGPKPRRADVRAILKTTVLWFNEADEKAGGILDTEEREDICAVLEEMAHLARQKVLVDEIEEWRKW